MDLPALLPEELKYTQVADNAQSLLNLLIKVPQDMSVFFQYACDDETWSENHPDFMKKVIFWMTDQFFKDKLQVDKAEEAAQAIRNHIQILEKYLPKNLKVTINDQEFYINSFLWEAGSDFLRTLIREECRDKNRTDLTLTDVSPEVFVDIDEYIRTGTVKELWRKEKDEVFARLRIATEWGLLGLMELCQDILKRYIAKDNVLDLMIEAHEEGWQSFRTACMEFVNVQGIGVQFHHTPEEIFFLEFVNFNDDALDVFDHVHESVTHLKCGGSLTSQSQFSEVINRCPRLICLDISESETFSDRLYDIQNQLQEIDLSECPWLNHKTLKKMVEICPNLESVSLTSNTQLNYTAWGELRGWDRLQRLNISRCEQINDEDLRVILQACTGLTHLFMSDCTRITERGFLEIGLTLPSLVELDLSRCSITDAALVDISTRCKNLSSLNLSRCVDLSEKGIIEVVRHSPNLRKLDVRRCNVSSTAIDTLREMRPLLEIIAR